MEQLGTIVLDNHQGPCLTPRALEYVEEFIPLAAIANGQGGFRWVMDEIVARLTPLVSSDALDAAIDKVLPDPPPYTSAAIGKRQGVTIEQYERLGLTHITPAGWGKRKLKGYRGKRRNRRVKNKRHANGESRTRRELSIEQLKPWTQPGAPCKSRPGFFRLPAPAREALITQARAAAMRPRD